MKKNEIKAAFGRIKPSETLVNETVKMLEYQKARMRRSHVHTTAQRNVKIAGAACAFALVFCLGFAAAKQYSLLPEIRTIAELKEVNSSNIASVMFENSIESGDEYIIINGKIENISFLDVNSDEKVDGVIRRCRVTVNALGLLKKTENLRVDLNKTRVEFEADIIFYDADIMNTFFDQSVKEMLLCLIPEENGKWRIVSFAPFE